MHVRRLCAWISSVGFVAALAAPMGEVFRSGGFESSARAELRIPAPRPRVPKTLDDALDLPRSFEAWYADHFGLRTELVRAHNRVMLSVFRRCPHPKMILGPTDWIFATESRGIEVFRGLQPFPARRLDGWRRLLEARAAWHAERGIVHLHALIPNKDRLYAEHVPAELTRVGPTRVEELTASLARHSDVRVLDLFAALEREKARDGEHGTDDWTYYRLGTHWTDRGAFAACEALLDELAARGIAVPRRTRAEFEILDAGEGDSVAPSMYVADLLPQRAWRWRVRDPRATYDEALVARNGATLESHHTDASLPSAVIFHDSFGENLRPILAESFSRAVFVWGDFDPTIVEEERPDVVLECFVDRTLLQVPPDLRLLHGERDALERFDASKDVLLSLAPPRAGFGVRAAERSEIVDLEGALNVRTRRGPAGVHIDLPSVEATAGLVLRIDVTTPNAGSFDVLYGTSAESTFERFNSTSAELVAGRKTVTLELIDDHFARALRLSFPPSKTGVLLHSLELRADHTPLGPGAGRRPR